MDLREYLDVLRARWRLVAVCTLLGVTAAATASMLTTPLYQATSRVFVSATDSGLNVGTAYTGSLFTQQRVKSYVDVITGTNVAQAVVDDLQLDLTPNQLAGKLKVTNPLDTVILEISATDPSPELAQAIANAATVQFGAEVRDIEQPLDGGVPLVKVTTIEAAELPTSPVVPRTTINLALGLLVGLAVGVGSAVLLETLDTRVKTVETLAKYFDQPLLAVIGFDTDAKSKPLVAHEAPQSKRAESFRQLRTNLQFVDVDHRPRSIVVTSSIPREGKSTAAANLAITIAQSGQPVFLIEGDLRRPKVAEYLGIEGGAGLTDILVGRATVDDVLVPWGPTGHLWVMPSGPLPPNPSELLGSQAMADLLHHLETRATLIIDAPPLLPVTDGAVLTKMAGGALIVAAAGKVRREQLRTAEESIDAVGGKILGLVFNMAPAKGPDAHRYGYSYSYEYGTTPSRRGEMTDHAPVSPAAMQALLTAPSVPPPQPEPNGSHRGRWTPSPVEEGTDTEAATPPASTTPTTPPQPEPARVAEPATPQPQPARAAEPASTARPANGSLPPPRGPSGAPQPVTARIPAPAASPSGAITPAPAPAREPALSQAPAAASEQAPRAAAAPIARTLEATPSMAPPAEVPVGRTAPVTVPAPAARPMPAPETPIARPAAAAPAPAPAPATSSAPSSASALDAPSATAAPAPSSTPPLADLSTPDEGAAEGWTPPAPRPAFDPLTAPLDELREHL